VYLLVPSEQIIIIVYVVSAGEVGWAGGGIPHFQGNQKEGWVLWQLPEATLHNDGVLLGHCLFLPHSALLLVQGPSVLHHHPGRGYSLRRYLSPHQECTDACQQQLCMSPASVVRQFVQQEKTLTYQFSLFCEKEGERFAYKVAAIRFRFI
jgi:hypothetical protein